MTCELGGPCIVITRNSIDDIDGCPFQPAFFHIARRLGATSLNSGLERSRRETGEGELMGAPHKTNDPVPDELIKRSRAAVTRARRAAAIAKEFDGESRARAASDIRKLQENSERLFQHVQNSLARARTLLASRPRQEFRVEKRTDLAGRQGED